MKIFSKKNGTYFQFFVASVANLMVITDGISMGWTSLMVPYFLSERTHMKMSRDQSEWLGISLILGEICGLPVTTFLLYNIGRKRTILVGTFLLIICWTVIGLASTVGLLYVARFANGLGLNMALVTAPMYIGEIASKEIRGFLSSNVYIMSVFGIVIIYSSGPYVPYFVPSIVCVVLLLTELIVFLFLPETPYFLAVRNDYERARKSLEKFRGHANVEDELGNIKNKIELERSQKGLKFLDIFLIKNYRKSLLIMLVLNSAQLFSGFEVILINLHEILEEAGSVYMEPALAAITFSVFNLLASIISSLLVDTFGRKKLLIISTILTALCLFCLAIYFNLKNIGYDTMKYNWIPITAVMFYAVGFKFGLGMVPIVLVAEIFHQKMKTYGMAVADEFYNVSSLIALLVFFGFRKLFGMHVPFYIFATYSIVACLYIIFYVPETKGKSLEEIQEMLRGEKEGNGDN